MSYRQVNFLHMLLLGPTMIYAGSLSKEQLGDTKNKSIDAVFSSIIVFALFIPFIVTNQFLGKIFKTSDDANNPDNPSDTSNNDNDNKLTNRDWILLTHYLVFFGLFLYIGSRGRKISKFLQIISIVIGVSQIVSHLYYLFKD
jgi:hypothetical protein